jgi:glycosyltransferase involved in cell wall biosynthesis
LYVAHYFSPNSAATVTTEEIMKMLLQKGHEVILLAPSTFMKKRLNINRGFDGLKLKAVSTIISNEVARRSKLASMLVATFGHLILFVTGLTTLKREGPFNLIITQYHTLHLAPLASFFLSIFMKTPLIVKIHDLVPGSPRKRRLEYIYSMSLSKINTVALTHAKRILSLSSEINEILTRSIGLEPTKVVVLPNTVDLTFSYPDGHVKEIRNRLGLDGKKIVFFMGSSFEDRGLDVLLKAMSIIEDEHIVLVVVGPYDREHINLARQLNVHNNVIFTGPVSHELVPLYIRMADVCVGPLIARSYTYGVIPRKVIECMACGRPVIVADGSVTRDLALDRVSVLFVNSNNESEVASAIKLLTEDISLASGISEGAQRLIAERYSTEKLTSRLDKVIVVSAARDGEISA